MSLNIIFINTMGNQTNRIPQFSAEQYSQQFKQLSKTSTGILLAHRQSNKQFFLKELNFSSKNAFLLKLESFKTMRASENVLSLSKVWAKERSSLCSESFQIFAVYEYPEICLRDQIDSRFIQNKPFDEHDIWSIAQACVNGITEQSAQIDISTTNIFIIEEGVLKLINQGMCDMLFRKVIDHREGVYYAPQKITRFNNGDQQNDIQKQAVFSLGMVMLQASLLKSVADFYDYDSYKFNPQKLNNYISIFQQQYSAQLTSLLTRILAINPNQRIGLRQLSQKMNQFWDDFQRTYFQAQSASQRVDEKKCKRRNRSSLLRKPTNELQHNESRQVFNCAQNTRLQLNNAKQEKKGSLIISHENSFIENQRQLFLAQQKKFEFGMKKQKDSINKQNIESLPINSDYQYLFTDQRFLRSICGSLTKSNRVFQEDQKRNKIMQAPEPKHQLLNTNTAFKINPSGLQEHSNNRKLTHCPTIPKKISFCNHIEKAEAMPVTGRIIKQYQRDAIQDSQIKAISSQTKLLSTQTKVLRKPSQQTQNKMSNQNMGKQQKQQNSFGIVQNLKFEDESELTESESKEISLLGDQQRANWVNNMIQNWKKYSGYFCNGLKHGNGKLYLGRSCEFEGQFYNGNIQGQGSFKYFEKGKEYLIKGVWINNKLNFVLN